MTLFVSAGSVSGSTLLAPEGLVSGMALSIFKGLGDALVIILETPSGLEVSDSARDLGEDGKGLVDMVHTRQGRKKEGRKKGRGERKGESPRLGVTYSGRRSELLDEDKGDGPS
ncbi:hypothetical protein BJ684DRAFT_17853 [Piptocephalis cylindrospora]|uniref:Uncharacterized protein n=1 Tax=Piptocephalis cylindrospora TaxID=1907219 RepID=A0A4P9XYN9_9FUNG|nr:hypothetical protein BJ684DRAFT_17853 [Piptocephalis cylindrospora]|eukprot:RKP11568.1 hypothetical protein BJ684DRAFT_17853 [Piptocephalis cylindrospora]